MPLHKESRPDRQGQIITVNHSAIRFGTAPSGTAGASWRRGLSLPPCQRDCSFISSRMCRLSCLGRGLSLQICHITQAPQAETRESPLPPGPEEVVCMPASVLQLQACTGNNNATISGNKNERFNLMFVWIICYLTTDLCFNRYGVFVFKWIYYTFPYFLSYISQLGSTGASQQDGAEFYPP